MSTVQNICVSRNYATQTEHWKYTDKTYVSHDLYMYIAPRM